MLRIMKSIFLKVFVLAVIWSFTVVSYAQPGCPAVNAGPNQTLQCGTSCTNLTATYFNTGGTNTYAVSSIPYTPFSYTAGTSILVNQDDIWSPAISLPFTFCFFGKSYTQVVVGANGLISFDVSNAGNGCVWNTTSSGTFPTTNMYTNVIMGVYHDIDPSMGGTIKYQIIGSAPCRMFIISWYNVPMYDDIFLVGSCWNIPKATHQIAIYETTNAIEVYVDNKSACTGWNDGLATLGIQDETGTKAYIASSYNNSVWSTNKKAWRFTPNGTSIVNIDWLQGGNVIGTGTTINVCPTAATTYTARATYQPCNNGTPVVETSTVTVTPNLQFQAIIDSSKNVTCNGAANGAAYAHVKGGLAPVSYGWNTAPNQTTITNLAPGTYTFTAQDGSGCNISNTVTITEPPVMTVNVPNDTQTTCSGVGTGTLIAEVSGGNRPYTYKWSGSAQTDSSLKNIAAGTYTVTVTDSEGCTAIASGTLTLQVGNNNVALTSPIIANVSCNKGSDGSITAGATGGSGNYTYTWSNAASGVTISNLPEGAYSVTVNDGAGCTATATYNITEPTAVVIANGIVTNVSCNGGSDASITVSPSGGTGVITCNWSNGQLATNTATALTAGNYAVVATDQKGCADTAAYVVTEPNLLEITALNVTNIGCNGGVGTISANVIGGTPMYVYSWVRPSDGQAFHSQVISGLTPDFYTVTVTDSKGCTDTASATVTQAPGIDVSITSSTNVSCFNSTDGTATTSVTGANGTITYTWSNGETGSTAINLPAGTQSVTVTDANNCLDTTTVVIGAPDSIYVVSYQVDSVSCFNGGDGVISISAIGGVGGLSYVWNNSQTDSVATNLAAGNYIVTITDANSCTTTFAAAVEQPTPINVTLATTKALCFGQASGTANTIVQGGTPPYTYVWSGGTGYGSSATNLFAGSYTLTVSDMNGCTTAQPFAVGEEDSLKLFAATTPEKCTYTSDGSISLSALGGVGTAYSFTISGNGLQQSNTTGLFENIPDGNYTVSVRDINNCLTSTEAVVQPATPDDFYIQADSTTCFGDVYRDGRIIIAPIIPANEPYLYAMLGSDYTSLGRFEKLGHGDYTIMVKNKNGCETTLVATVPQPEKLEAQIAPVLLKIDLGESATISVKHNGRNNITYSWAPTNGLSCVDCPNPMVSPFTETTYTLYLKDSPDGRKFCTAEASFTVEVGPHGEVLVPNMFSPNGDGINDVFYVYGNNVRDIRLTVFNRWGEKVFDADSMYKGWDGTYRNVAQSPGVYTYVVEFTFLDNQKLQKQGTVTLVR